MDSVIAVDQQLRELNQQYLEVVSKTNEQLGLWTNPYGLMVGILSFILAVLAIGAGIILYFQSSDFKQRISDLLTRYSNILDGIISEKDTIIAKMDTHAKEIIERANQQAKSVDAALSAQIEAYKNEVAESANEKKQELEAAIAKLQKAQSELEANALPVGTSSSAGKNYTTGVDNTIPVVNPEYVDSSYGALGIAGKRRFHKCSHCGFGYIIDDSQSDRAAISYMLGGSKIAKCPKCQNAEKI
jgi:hypothetical protein